MARTKKQMKKHKRRLSRTSCGRKNEEFRRSRAERRREIAPVSGGSLPLLPFVRSGPIHIQHVPGPLSDEGISRAIPMDEYVMSLDATSEDSSDV